jgi:uncharacterized protein with FMN-binding domain
MKKILSTIIVLSIIISFVGCSNKNSTLDGNRGSSINESPSNNGNVGRISSANTPYKDGTYNAMGDTRPNGNETATVVIKDGNISNVTLGSIDKNGNRIVYNNGSGAGNNVPGIDDALGGSNRNNGYNTGHNTTSDNVRSTPNSDTINKNNNTLTTTPSISLDQLRIDLANAIVQYQTTNITVNTNNEYDVVLNNWRLAVRRALDQSEK